MNASEDDEQVYLLFGWTIEVDENFRNMKDVIRKSLRFTQFLFLLIIVSAVLGLIRAARAPAFVIVILILHLFMYGLLWYFIRSAIMSNESICGGSCSKLNVAEIILWLMSIIFLADVINAILAIVGSDVIGGVIRLLINCVKLSLSVALILNVRQLSKVYSQLVNNDEVGENVNTVGGEIEC